MGVLKKCENGEGVVEVMKCMMDITRTRYQEYTQLIQACSMVQTLKQGFWPILA